jgi:hypothetical protein
MLGSRKAGGPHFPLHKDKALNVHSTLGFAERKLRARVNMRLAGAEKSTLPFAADYNHIHARGLSALS